MTKAMRGPRLSRSNHVCGGCLALHKEAFKRLSFDPWIARGEDLDYMLDLRMYGSDIWLDNQWSLRHLPPETRKRGHALPPGHLPLALRVPQDGVQPHADRPHAGEALLARAVSGAVFGAGHHAGASGLTAFLRSLARPDKQGVPQGGEGGDRRGDHIRRSATARSTSSSSSCGLSLWRAWRTTRFCARRSSSLLHSGRLTSTPGRAVPPQPARPAGIDPGVTSEIRLNIAE